MTDLAAPFITADELGSLSGVRHGFFGRRGGQSRGIYAGLNAGPGSRDEAADVAANRAAIAKAVGAAPGHLIGLHQVHSNTAVRIGAAQKEGAARPKADGMATDVPGLALCVLSADCVPVLLADDEAGVVGAAHAGWKGALGGVLEATTELMESMGARRTRMRAAVGPCIGQASYEVGPEYRERFAEALSWSKDFFAPGEGDRWQFDIGGFAVERLRRAGIGSVERLARDTCALDGSYFSHRRQVRRGEADYGRNASVILLTAR